MIKEITLKRWKSFDKAKLFVDPLTVLIGPNAGGKSNALDSLRYLQRTASGRDLTAAIKGDNGQQGIRGGLEWAALKPNTSFEINVLIQSETEKTEYFYSLEVEVKNRCELLSESLKRLKRRSLKNDNPYEVFLFRTEFVSKDDPSITAKLYNKRQGTMKMMSRTSSILSQLFPLILRKEIAAGVEEVVQALRSIFVLDPIPSHMRDYCPLSEQLLPDASNIAGVIAALPQDKKQEIEDALMRYMRSIPEPDLQRIWAEPVGKFNSDAMLYCEEKWGDETSIIDARGMSDGTLRFLAVLTALLTRPERSLLVVEEVDNGLHPSRVSLLIRMLREVGDARKVDVLVTTHNPALLDVLSANMIPFIFIAHRDPVSGFSNLTLLEEIEQLPKLLATGPLGKLSTEGKLQQALLESGESK